MIYDWAYHIINSEPTPQVLDGMVLQSWDGHGIHSLRCFCIGMYRVCKLLSSWDYDIPNWTEK